MLILLFFIVILIIGIVMCKNSWCYQHDLEIIGGIIVLIMCICLVISSIVLIAQYSEIDGFVAQSQERYNSLIYKAKNINIKDDLGLINKSYADEVQKWNEDVVKFQAIQDNIWTGIFYPNVYNQFKTIDLNTIQTK